MPRDLTPRGPHEIAVGLRLFEARTKSELTQDQLAAKLGCSGPLLVGYEKGRRRLSTDFLEKYAEATGVTMSWLLTGDIPEERRKAQTDDELAALEAARDVPERHKAAYLRAILALSETLKKS